MAQKVSEVQEGEVTRYQRAASRIWGEEAGRCTGCSAIAKAGCVLCLGNLAVQSQSEALPRPQGSGRREIGPRLFPLWSRREGGFRAEVLNREQDGPQMGGAPVQSARIPPVPSLCFWSIKFIGRRGAVAVLVVPSPFPLVQVRHTVRSSPGWVCRRSNAEIDYASRCG